MKTIKKIFFLFAASLMIGGTVQAQCNASNSPTFQVTVTQATLATNGFCNAYINIMNASTTPPGGPVSYSLMAPGQSSVIIGPTPTVATVAGVWTVMVTDNSNFCVTSQTVQVNILPAPPVSIAASNTLVCSGYLATLTASGANSYTWNTNATTASISVASVNTLTYSVTGTGSNGCANKASVVVNRNPLPTITVTANQNSVCLNQTVQLTAQGATTYSWSTLQAGAAITVTPGATTLYTVYGTDANGCESNSQILVSVSPCTSVEKLKLTNEELKIYPVPAKDFLELKINNENLTEGFRTISVYNNLGQLLRQEELVPIDIGIRDKTFNLKTNDLCDGIYFLQLKSNESGTVSKRFIISR